MAEEDAATVKNDEEQDTATATDAQEQDTPAAKNTVTIEEAGPCKKKVIVEIPEETIKRATDEQYEKLRKEAMVPGFRKGRAPRRLLEKRFGKETSEQTKLKLLLDASESAMKDNELDVLREPDIDHAKIELPETGPLTFDFEVDVRPEFDLPELEGIPVDKTKLEVTDEQIDREIEHLRRMSGVWSPRHEGKVELEDQIIADAELKVEDVEEEEKLGNIEVFVRAGGFVGEVPVEKLDELLVGAEAGDVKETSVEIPETYFREQYRGKKVDVRITVKDIKWLKPAELDQDFLKRYGVDDETELRERLGDALRDRLEQQSRTGMTEQIFKYLLEGTDFELPVDIVAEHAGTLLQRQYSNLLMRGLSREHIEQHMDRLKAGSAQQAQEQLKTFFIMDRVAEKLEVEVTDEEINGHIAQLAIQRGQRPERMREQMERDGSLAQFKLQVRENKCIAKLLESAKITEVEAKKQTKKKAKKVAKKAASSEKKQKATKEKADK
jgi:trigger factor